MNVGAHLGSRETWALLDIICLQSFFRELYDGCCGIHFCPRLRSYDPGLRSLCIQGPGIYGQVCPNLVSYMATYDDVVRVLQVLAWSD